MTEYTSKWKPVKAEKKAATARTTLLPGEEMWFLGVCNNLRLFISDVALTSLRVVGLQDRAINFQMRYADIANVVFDAKKDTVEITSREGARTVLKMVPRADHEVMSRLLEAGRSSTPPDELLHAADDAAAEAAASSARVEAAKGAEWPDSIVRGKLGRKASEAILRQCHKDEQPWLILTSSAGAGTLAAFGDRVIIIKTGALTSFMAGSLGGERSATFHFTDITGIEYNSGFVNGVLEVLTPSYSGTANHDFWSGASKSRNSAASDPYTLSNTLPLSKPEYNACLPEINELKARISRAKAPTMFVAPAPAPVADGLAEQIQKLADLRTSGVLSDDEFASAKARLIAQ
ncbi:SHOCT domain-containing protein [Curtobacterium sp. MCBD17_030]|uniref:SHOCT domain-containing protein n=1 Tax=Curtobacterium sp. MCBD17_030 TaxID=2175649 RepID=UPI000D9B9FFF|nr:SHOCT domain-containing protein [Curtobacterium sp. MCBD17_030]PYY32777.1 hypothetical protein DEI89_11910 [Curtobacterium sp. MCBD17_030]